MPIPDHPVDKSCQEMIMNEIDYAGGWFCPRTFDKRIGVLSIFEFSNLMDILEICLSYKL